MTVTCPVNDTAGICTSLDSAGAGLAVVMQYIMTFLPALLIILVILGGIAGIITAVALAIKGAITKHR